MSTTPSLPQWDFFISYASEDRNSVARPLAERLRNRGFKVWYDRFELRIGDPLRQTLERGVSSCKFGIVILSPAFAGKRWPQQELDGLFAREQSGTRIILPVWHNLTEPDAARLFPFLADRVAATTDEGLDAVIYAVIQALGTPSTGTRQVFLMHVGHPGNIDISYTVTRRRRISEVIRKLPEDAPELGYFENSRALHEAFPDGHFNCWGVPSKAGPSFNRTNPGDLVLFVPSIGLAGGIQQIGIVKEKCHGRCHMASRVLWPKTPDQRLFPLIFFFDTEVGHRGWFEFLNDVGYDPGWNPKGWYRPVATSRLKSFGGPEGYLRFLREECGFAPLQADASIQ